MTYGFDRHIYINGLNSPLATYPEFTDDGKKPRKWGRERIIATLAMSLFREKDICGSGATAFDSKEIKIALDEVSCGNKVEFIEEIKKSD